MDKNETYFDYIGAGAQPSDEHPKAERGSGHGLFLVGLVVGMGCTLLLVAIAYLGFGLQEIIEHREQMVMAQDSAVDKGLMSKIQLLEDLIDEYYYLDEVSEEQIQTGIYRGLMNSLGDPYTVYYSAEELTSLMEDMEGTFYGIGAHVSLDAETGFPILVSFVSGAPAEAAGLHVNDLIYEVDGEPVYGLSLDDVVRLIRGEENTEVLLSVIREGADELLEITVVRGPVEMTTVNMTMLEDGMAYIQIQEFDNVTVDQFAEALAVAKGSGMEGLIIDLRGNPGGTLDSVVDICRMILPKGLIVYTEDKYGQREEYTCDGSRELDVPLVLLVDVNSASASEVMAGAIKDHGKGTLVGTTTFGKGIVQHVISLWDGSAVKITTEAYYTPNGYNIHGIGIEPDVVCPFDGEAYYGSEDHPDNQLEKAKEVLAGLMGR